MDWIGQGLGRDNSGDSDKISFEFVGQERDLGSDDIFIFSSSSQVGYFNQ